MLKIQRNANGKVIFALTGKMNEQNVPELRSVIESEESGHQIILDLRDVTLVDREAVRYLERCETQGIKLENCPAYIRKWILGERNAK
jgi:anti-anti-sigma regulatory factor